MSDFVVKVNGKELGFVAKKGYCEIERQWKKGDTVEVVMNMPVHRIKAHDKVEQNRGRLAVERGPVVYCAEGADNNGKAFDAILPATANFDAVAFSIVGQACLALKADNGLTLIPYCLWGNRQPGNEMQVWFRSE